MVATRPMHRGPSVDAGRVEHDRQPPKRVVDGGIMVDMMSYRLGRKLLPNALASAFGNGRSPDWTLGRRL